MMKSRKKIDEKELQRIIEKWSAVLDSQPLTGCQTAILLESKERWFTKEEREAYNNEKGV